MNKSEELLKKADIPKIASQGTKIYERIKNKYDNPGDKGKFLAIEIESGKVYLGNNSVEALEKAREKHPDKVFYVVKIGYDVAETMAKSIAEG